VPVEFSDITFASEGTADFNSAINEKMKEMLDFYKKISWNASEIESELKWDIAPIYKSTETRAHYGRDVPTEKSNIHGLNYIVDAGDFGKSKAGSSALKKEACSYLVNEKKIPMRKYRHIIYFVPGDGGNTSPSDQIWPASNSAWPGAIIKIPFTDIVTGTTFAGIMQSIKKNTGTICHEFGHQFGLPDLYPFLNSNKLKERDLGVAGLMASGSHYGVGMTGMSKKRSYMGKSKKKNWLGKNRVVKIKENGQFKIYSRDSDDSPNLLLVSIKSTWDPDDYFIVELFDRIGPDKNMPAKIKKDGNYFSAAAGVFIYHSDDDDVEDIHYLKSLPVEHDWDKRFFMPGGVLEMLGVKIEIKDLTETENSWSALINVQYDDKVKKPEGFVNTVKGIGIFLKNKMKDLFISQSTPISKSK
jgi:M6 family metalloprotease-like protein